MAKETAAAGKFIALDARYGSGSLFTIGSLSLLLTAKPAEAKPAEKKAESKKPAAPAKKAGGRKVSAYQVCDCSAFVVESVLTAASKQSGFRLCHCYAFFGSSGVLTLANMQSGV